MGRALKLFAGVAVSAVCVWLSMRDVRLTEVLAALRHARPLGFLGVFCATLLGFWLRAVRWRPLLATEKRIGGASLFSATMIGFMANNLLPFRLGEFVRPWVLGRREGISKTRVFATVVVERVVDMLTLIAILGLALWVHPISETSEAGRLTRLGARTLVVMALALTLVIVVLEHQPKLMLGLVHKLTDSLPAPTRQRARAVIEQFLEGLGLFRDLPRLLWVFLLSVLMFGVVVLGVQASLWAMRIDLPWYGGLLILVVTAIGIMVPAAPGYIGTLNLACVAGLALFSVGKAQAVPFSWFYWAGQWLPVTLVGLYCLRREGLSLANLGHVREEGT